MTTRLLLAAAGMAAIALPTAVSAQKIGSPVVAVVDSGRIFRECTACVAATGQLQAQAQRLQARAQQLNTTIRTEAQPVQTAVDALAGKAPDAALQGRIRALQTRQESANQELGTGEQTLRSTQANIQQQLASRLGPVVNQVMGQRGANVVIDKGVTLAAAPTLDITNDVLTAFNAAVPSVSVTPLPQQAAPAGTAPAPATQPARRPASGR